MNLREIFANRAGKASMVATVIACLCFGASPVQADLLLDLKYTDGTTAKVVSSGDSVFVDLILSDPDGGVLPPGITLAGEGLGSGGGLIAKIAGALIIAPGPITAGPGFDPTTLVAPVPLPTPGIVNSVLVFGPVFPFPMPVGLGTTSITIATFELFATGAPGDTAVLAADILDPSGFLIGNETFATFTNLDALLGSLGAPAPGAGFGSVSLEITTVPAPGASAVIPMALGALALRRRHRA